MDWDQIAKFVGVLAAIVALGKGITEYLKLKHEQVTSPSESPLKLLSVTSLPKYEPWRKLKPLHGILVVLILSLGLSVLYFAFATFWFYLWSADKHFGSGASSLGSLLLLFALVLLPATFGYLYLLVARNCLPALNILRKSDPEGPTTACRKAEMMVEGSLDEVVTQCMEALKSINAQIVSVSSQRDSGKAYLEGRTGYGWGWSPFNLGRYVGLVDKITISCGQVENRVVIKVTSDGVRPTMTANHERNSSNVRNIIEQLVG